MPEVPSGGPADRQGNQHQRQEHNNTTALLAIDLQLDFLPGGSMAVPEAHDIITQVNKIRRSCRDGLAAVAYTQDYHVPNHVSFLSSHTPLEGSTPSQDGSMYTDLQYDCKAGTLLSCSLCGPACPVVHASQLASASRRRSLSHGLDPASDRAQHAAPEPAGAFDDTGTRAHHLHVGHAGDLGHPEDHRQEGLNRRRDLQERIQQGGDGSGSDSREGGSKAGEGGSDPTSMMVLRQRLWPVHSVQGQPGCDLHPDLLPMPDDIIVRKGTHLEVDGYSAFFDNERVHASGLHEQLQERHVGRLLLAGVATDYCVLWTARDAVSLGYEVWLVSDAVRGLGGSWAALEEMSHLHGLILKTTEQVISSCAKGRL